MGTKGCRGVHPHPHHYLWRSAEERRRGIMEYGGVWVGTEGYRGVWRSVEECGGVWRGVEGCGGVWRGVEECERV
jgi:hypothetical protein